jgi:hypothetical protein
VKLYLEVMDTSLALTEKLVLDGDPGLAHGIWNLMDELHQHSPVHVAHNCVGSREGSNPQLWILCENVILKFIMKR